MLRELLRIVRFLRNMSETLTRKSTGEREEQKQRDIMRQEEDTGIGCERPCLQYTYQCHTLERLGRSHREVHVQKQSEQLQHSTDTLVSGGQHSIARIAVL